MIARWHCVNFSRVLAVMFCVLRTDESNITFCIFPIWLCETKTTNAVVENYVCLSVRPSDKRVHCDKKEERYV